MTLKKQVIQAVVTTAQPKLTQILERLCIYLKDTYQQTLDNVILFGSQARGDAQADSDIDILIVLNINFDNYQESKKISQFISDLCLDYDIAITCFFTSLEQWQTRTSTFFRNIRREGIDLAELL